MKVINIQYFKPSGKFYTECKTYLPVEYADFEIGKYARTLSACGKLPGLLLGTWEGYAHMYIEDDIKLPQLVALSRKKESTRQEA